jgi:hypothetical protein
MEKEAGNDTILTKYGWDKDITRRTQGEDLEKPGKYVKDKVRISFYA